MRRLVTFQTCPDHRLGYEAFIKKTKQTKNQKKKKKERKRKKEKKKKKEIKKEGNK